MAKTIYEHYVSGNAYERLLLTIHFHKEKIRNWVNTIISFVGKNLLRKLDKYF